MNNQLRKTNKCVIWTRVSTAKQEKDGGSLEYQKKLCLNYAKEHKLNVVWRDSEQESPFGGTHESAKQIGKLCREMINLVKKDTSISKIICSQFDRLSRDRGDAIKLMDSLRAIGVTIVEAISGTDTSDSTAALLACFKFSTATLDNEIRADKFYNGRKHCYESGAYTGILPIGYTRTDPKTGEKTKSLNSYCYLNEHGQKIRFAFAWKLQGYTNGEILDKLSCMGLTITKQTLNHIFNNPFYAGKIQSKMLDNGMVDGKIEKAVSYMDWLKIQKIMSDRAGWYKHKKHVEDAPLKGDILCAECGKPLTAYRQKGHWYYKCNTIGCKFNMSAVKLHAKYHNVLQGLEIPKELCALYEEMIGKVIKEGNEEKVRQTTLLKKERTEIEKKISACTARYATGEISKDIYTSAITAFEARIREIEADLEECGEILSNYQKRVNDILLMCSNTSTWWDDADYETRKRIQKLAFPNGILYDRQKCNYRTENRNGVFDVIDRISASYRHKKEAPSEEDASSCAG